MKRHADDHRDMNLNSEDREACDAIRQRNMKYTSILGSSRNNILRGLNGSSHGNGEMVVSQSQTLLEEDSRPQKCTVPTMHFSPIAKVISADPGQLLFLGTLEELAGLQTGRLSQVTFTPEITARQIRESAGRCTCDAAVVGRS